MCMFVEYRVYSRSITLFVPRIPTAQVIPRVATFEGNIPHAERNTEEKDEHYVTLCRTRS